MSNKQIAAGWRGWSVLVALGLGLAILAPLGCDIFDDDDDPITTTQSARLNVYGTDAPGDIQEFWVRLLELTIYDESGQGFLLTPTGESDTVDLVAAANDTPGFLRQFELPPGTYNAISGGLELDRLVVEDAQGDPQTCTEIQGLGDSLVLPGPVQFNGPVIVVGEGDEIDLIIDIPLDTVTGTCDPNTGVASLTLPIQAVQVSQRGS